MSRIPEIKAGGLELHLDATLKVCPKCGSEAVELAQITKIMAHKLMLKEGAPNDIVLAMFTRNRSFWLFSCMECMAIGPVGVAE